MEKAAFAVTQGGEGMFARCRPLLYCYEKEIVLYAHYNKLLYFSTECSYNGMAFRGNLRGIMKDLERLDSVLILNVLYSGTKMPLKEVEKTTKKRLCEKCGFASSNKLCKTCTILEKFNKDKPAVTLT